MKIYFTKLMTVSLLACASLVLVNADSGEESDSPITLTLELAETELALAEPTMLRLEITNVSQDEILVNNVYMFSMFVPPFNLSINLISPDGEDTKYKLEYLYYAVVERTYSILRPGESVSSDMLLWWTPVLPERYQRSLEQLPPGNYKLYATYRLPEINQLGEVFVSDTINFVFRPAEPSHVPVLREMDTLWEFFHCKALSKGFANERLPYISESNTPYSEAAEAWLAMYQLNFSPPDEWFEVGMSNTCNFLQKYPDSPFEAFFIPILIRNAKYVNQLRAVDSLAERLNIISPNHRTALLTQDKIEIYGRED